MSKIITPVEQEALSMADKAYPHFKLRETNLTIDIIESDDHTCTTISIQFPFDVTEKTDLPIAKDKTITAQVTLWVHVPREDIILNGSLVGLRNLKISAQTADPDEIWSILQPASGTGT